MRRLWPVVLIAVVAVIPVWRAALTGEMVGAFDQIRQMKPWNGPSPEAPWDVLQADSVLQFYPWRDMVLRAWRDLEIPGWNPSELAGTPLLANSQSGGLYPPHVLLGLIFVPTPIAVNLLAWFHLFVAGLGAYALARQLNASRPGGALAGVSFTLSAFMVSWTALPSVPSTAAWTPWCLWAVLRMSPAREPGPNLSERLGKCALLAVFVALMLLGGHLQIAAYGLFATVFLAICLLAIPGATGRARLRAAALVIAGIGLGGALAGPQVLPVLEYGKYSHRRNAPTEEGYRAYVSSAITLLEVQTGILFPDMLGLPGNRIQPDSPLQEFWPALVRRGANFAESAIGISPLILGLWVVGLATRSPQRWAIAAIGFLALLMALGTPLNRLPYFLAPGWSSTGSPGRISFLFVLAACVGAGCGLSRDLFQDRRRVLAGVLCAGGVSLTLLALSLGASPSAAATAASPPNPAIEAAVAQVLIRRLPYAAAAVLVAVGCIFAMRRGWGWAPVAALAAAVALPAFQYATSVVPTGSPILIANARPGAGRVAALNEEWSLQAAAPAVMPPNTSYYLGLPDIAGYDSLLHRDTKALLDSINGRDSAPAANGNMMFIKPGFDVAKLEAAGVERVFSREPLQGLGEPARIAGELFQYRLKGVRASTPAGQAQVLDSSSSRLLVRAVGPGKLVVRDRNMPGWTAWVEGRETPIAGTTWREVDIPSGAHNVLFTYEPPGMRLGVWLATAAIALMGLSVGAARLTERRRQALGS